jgi:hypothetical protein
VQDFVDDPESPKQVRQALLSEPVIHVRSLSSPDHSPVDPVSASRPVVVERAERQFPKDDLLTPRDVAKAFQLEFGPDVMDRFLAKPNQTVKKIKIALTSTAALSLAAVLLWPVTHIASDWINSNSAHAAVSHAPAENPAPADSQFSNQIAYAPPEKSMVPSIPSTPPATPIVASAVMTPVVQPEPAPTPSPDDDPKLLWNSALEAESTGNYRAAVQTYERIESLPSDSWPAHLETRLKLARKELKGDVR